MVIRHFHSYVLSAFRLLEEGAIVVNWREQSQRRNARHTGNFTFRVMRQVLRSSDNSCFLCEQRSGTKRSGQETARSVRALCWIAPSPQSIRHKQRHHQTSLRKTRNSKENFAMVCSWMTLENCAISSAADREACICCVVPELASSDEWRSRTTQASLPPSSQPLDYLIASLPPYFSSHSTTTHCSIPLPALSYFAFH